MAATIFHILSLVSLLAYLAAGYSYYRQLLSSPGVFSGRSRSILLLGMSAHLILNCVSLIYPGATYVAANQVNFVSRASALSWVSLVLLFIFVVLDQRKVRIAVLGVFFVPLAALYMFLAIVLFHIPRNVQTIDSQGTIVAIHVALIILSHAAFVFAFGISLALLIQETALKRKRFNSVILKLPSLVQLDRFNTSAIASGFVLMLLGVSLGLVTATLAQVNFVAFDLRIVSTLLSLLVYLAVLIAKFVFAWRGRRIALLTIGGFVVLLASSWGVFFFGNSFHVY